MSRGSGTRCEEKLRELGSTAPEADDGRREHRVFRPTWQGMRVERENGAYVVAGEEIERLALKTDWDSPEGVENFQRELERKGVVGALRRAGAESR